MRPAIVFVLCGRLVTMEALRLVVVATTILLSTSAIAQEGDPDSDACLTEFDRLPAIDLREKHFFSKQMEKLAKFDQGMKCREKKWAAKVPKITDDDRRAVREREVERRKFEGIVAERRTSLRAAGVTLEFGVGRAAWVYRFHGCLVGQGGSLYTYNEKLKLVESRLPDQEYKKAVELVKHLTIEAFQSRQIRWDGGGATWTLSVDGSQKTLKEIGDTEGELADSNARQLVQLINDWCPMARGAIEAEDRFKPVLERIAPVSELPVAHTGTAEEAKEMLQQAISELRRDPQAAVREFDRVFWKDLSVLCVGEDGRVATRSLRPGWKNEKDRELLERAVENQIDTISFVSSKAGPSKAPVAREAYVTRVGSIACGVSYVK